MMEERVEEDISDEFEFFEFLFHGSDYH